MIEHRYKKIRERNRAFLTEIKKENPCKKCGEKRAHLLDFHHVEKDKEFTIANSGSTTYSIEKIKLEIEKCVVLCSNCHRDFHFLKITLEEYIGEYIKLIISNATLLEKKERLASTATKGINSKTGFLGVGHNRRRKKGFYVSINRKETKIFKWFSTAREASEFYDKTIVSLDGELAVTNKKLGL